MARVTVHHGIDRLAADMAKIAPRARADMVVVVGRGIRTGASVARDFAKVSGGSHAGVSKKTGKVQPYVKSITHEMRLYGGLGLIAGEYGPDPALPQGNLRLEGGEGRQTRPHLNLARSADLIGPALAGEVRRLPSRWFW